MIPSGPFIRLYKTVGPHSGIAKLAVLTAAGGGSKLSRIAEELGCSTASITSTVDKLVRDGLVKRVDHTYDRRSWVLERTADGEKYLSDAQKAVEDPK